MSLFKQPKIKKNKNIENKLAKLKRHKNNFFYNFEKKYE